MTVTYRQCPLEDSTGGSRESLSYSVHARMKQIFTKDTTPTNWIQHSIIITRCIFTKNTIQCLGSFRSFGLPPVRLMVVAFNGHWTVLEHSEMFVYNALDMVLREQFRRH